MVGGLRRLVGHFEGFVGRSFVGWTLFKIGWRLAAIRWTLQGLYTHLRIGPPRIVSLLILHSISYLSY